MSKSLLCVDIGSTFTKAVTVATAEAAPDSPDGVGVCAHLQQLPTSIATDVLDAVGKLEHLAGLRATTASSSAGGGLRLAVVGYERAVTAEAGHRAALSAGGKVVHISAGPLNVAALAELTDAAPDVVLLVGGTDGGNAEVLLHNASVLGASELTVPVVSAGNSDVREQVEVLLQGNEKALLQGNQTEGRQGSRREVVSCANVLPQIGVLDVSEARAAIREVFIRHVIGGKHLTRDVTALTAIVACATPDAVLAGVELLADVTGAGVLVVDVGGATTDVYSVIDLDELNAPPGYADVAGSASALRSVEGDLGVRWNAPEVVEAAVAQGLISPDRASSLAPLAQARRERPDWLPSDELGRQVDRELASLAATVAVRRHARGRDLRGVRLMVASGGACRHAAPAQVLDALLSDVVGGWLIPDHARVVTDHNAVLSAAGLLAASHPETARQLLRSLWSPRP